METATMNDPLSSRIVRGAKEKIRKAKATVTRGQFAKTAAANLRYRSYFGKYTVGLTGPHADTLPGCTHETAYHSVAYQAVNEALRFCDKNGIRIEKLTVEN